MRLGSLPGRPHLTYCLNVHPGEDVASLLASIRAAGAVRSALGEPGSMGVGLRLAGTAVRQLDADASAGAAVRAALRAERLYAFTANAFPHGAFHQGRVKEAVYEPDWLQPRRAAYTIAAARVLASLLDEHAEGLGSVSTVPVGFRARAGSSAARGQAGGLLRECAGELARIRERTGVHIVLGIEPEPACVLETTAEAVAFVEEHVLARGGEAAREHVGLCLDLCHAAVLGEDPAEALARPSHAGVKVAKVQISSAIEIALGGPGPDEERALAAIARFDDGVYLHQVVEDGASRRAFTDLPDALAAHRLARASGDDAPRRWRIHAHVPVFLERAGDVGTTQAALRSGLEVLRTTAVSPHLEVETYTWGVLPPEARGATLENDVARELAWVRAVMAR